MLTETTSDTSSTDRRAADAMPLKFEGAALKKVAPMHAAFADADVEMIDMDAALPPGHAHEHADDFHAAAPVASATTMSAEQKKARLDLVKFKHSYDGFEASSVTQVTINNIKRGDIIEIKTIVGGMYIRIVDRIKGDTKGVGEILCECRYDLQDQWALLHAASITLPLCSKTHVIQNPDGSTRLASRALKMTADIALPEQVSNLLRENFFVEINIHANPEGEKLRMIDVWRWLVRVGHKIKALIDANNRKEREKKEREEERRRLKKEAKRRKAEEQGQ